MAWIDLGAVLALAALLLWRRRGRLAGLAALLGAAATAAAVHLCLQVSTYRGSSGIAAALFTAAALDLVRPRSSRSLGLAALLLFGLKTFWEAWSGEALATGWLPPGIAVQPLVHLAGGLAGALAVWMETKIPLSREHYRQQLEEGDSNNAETEREARSSSGGRRWRRSRPARSWRGR